MQIARADQEIFKTTTFQIFEDRNPVDTYTFHCNGGRTMRFEPVADALRINWGCSFLGKWNED